MQRHVIRHLLPYQNVGSPDQVWGTLKSGKNVGFRLGIKGSGVPRWPGALVWGGKVPLTGPDALKSITARWTNGAIDTIPWPEAVGSSGGTTWHLLTNPQALKKWWPDIQQAARQAGSGIPRTAFEDAIGATMLHESGGNPGVYANGNPNGAYGLMQIEPGTARGLPGYYPGARHNPQENLILGAELLAELYRETGSWHMMAATYYVGSPPSGWYRGMPWSAAQRLLDYVPAGGNVQTVAGYADQTVAEMTVVAQEAPKG
ncbi:transglycosylase SLT domain-containing protein [Sulfobacillus sp. DSM 109850]|uniref:Transglycosylase SLT domain-containing protein n=2 Tax=Sulfobacillus harzensis TaxID=2729629 RepID=A0A7Y0L5S2_9FIRM|nr:transglycosylase SLT domain-containing protein [Sulfobacillus harzensis]